MAHLEAGKSTLGEFAGRGLFASKEIPKDQTFDISLAVKAFQVLPSTWTAVDDFYEWASNGVERCFVRDRLACVVAFTEGYGYISTLFGRKHFTIDSGIPTFCNHGCNGSYNYGEIEDGGAGVRFTELNIDLKKAPGELLNKASKAFSPVFERHLRQITATGDYTLREIKKGEEIFCNYLSFVGDPDEWEAEIESLREQCAGNTVGEVTEYELKAHKKLA